jgi:two-component system sensor histidine kinase AlgZ
MNSLINKHRVLSLHLLFWCVYLSFNLYQVSFFQRDEPYDWWRVLLGMSFTMTIAYLNYFVMLPSFLRHKNLGRFLLEFAIPFTLLIAVRIFLQRATSAHNEHSRYLYSTFFVVNTAVITLLITIFIGTLRFVKEWFELEAKKQEIENERLVSELNFLKAQINPHFLFNTLNNLYYLAYSKSDNTTEVIAKLSQMMRYMIHDSNYPQVPLSKEIEYMQSYISLERLRLNNQIPIQFDIEGNPDAVKIAPLILITFLENAFKHGVNGNNPAAWVKLAIQLNGKECVYTVENSKLQSAHSENEKSGIGLQNVKRRLELSYPGNYELNVSDLPDRYSIQLKLILS